MKWPAALLIAWGRVAVLTLCAGALGSAASTVGSVADAAERASHGLVRSLLDGGADPNSPQVDGMTALHWAAYHEDAATSELLLAAGADPDASNRYGVTPLHLACESGNAEVTALLLAAGADANLAARGGETPLMTAARSGGAEVVRALLERGAEVGARESVSSQSALMWAAAEGHADVVRLLVGAGANVKYRLGSGFTPLLFAVREGSVSAVEALLEAGADPNDSIRPPPDAPSRARGVRGAPPFGASALHIAVENAHYSLATKLLAAGADPSAAIPGYTPLHLIARVRKPGVGDNDPPPDGSGSMTSLEFVKEMVERGADIDARMTKNVKLGNTRFNRLGATLFLLAAHSADAELMRTLVGLGADPFAVNEDGSTALMAAAGLGTRSPGEDAGTEAAVLEAVRLLLDLGLDINALNAKGETAMHGAAYKNLPKVVELLAAEGADIEVWNRPNQHGWTPLVIATGYRFGNFKPSPVTIDALRRVMIERGVVPPERVQAETEQIY